MSDAPALGATVATFTIAAASWLPAVRDVASILASICALVVGYYAVRYYREHRKP